MFQHKDKFLEDNLIFFIKSFLYLEIKNFIENHDSICNPYLRKVFLLTLELIDGSINGIIFCVPSLQKSNW